MRSEDLCIQYVTPEVAGISSEKVQQFIERLEKNRYATHSLILAKGNQIFFENYWSPFHKDFLHRMYSVSKSFVGIAIGFLEQDKLINLDDKISKYFPKELARQPDHNMHNQTIRHMLMMSTAKTSQNWFEARTEDRVQFYFANDLKESRASGTIWEYDSSGSFILGALVERILGKSFMEYLKEKLFRKIGVSEDAYCLQCPGGHSWGDSAVICRPMDLFLVARFMLNGGSWNGEQILNKEYVKAAVSKQIDNNFRGINDFTTQGYGYQIWRTFRQSFFFYGMGSQYAVCVPDKDIIMVYNADNQGKEAVCKDIFNDFFELIVDHVQETSLPGNQVSYQNLLAYAKEMKLVVAEGDVHSEWEDKINNVTYMMDQNPMEITSLKVIFNGKKGCLAYHNTQGYKEIVFGLGYNEYGVFPQEGYSADIGSVYAKGNYYECAASAGWIDEKTLRIQIQIIDIYFGNLSITLGFAEGKVGVYMVKSAEDFLNEYQGFGCGYELNASR